MNAFFWLLVVLVLVLIWFLFSFAFGGIGSVVTKLFTDAVYNIKKGDKKKK